jgi:probable F420-dependent oxidoreductase
LTPGRRFRFGISASAAPSRAEWQDKARRAEDLGYATLLVADHVGSLLSPMAAMVSAADATRTLRVGTNVLNNDLRNPLILGQEAATVDLLTDGRLELGLGAGYMASEYAEAGITFESGSRRVQKLAETLAILRPQLPAHTPLLVGGDGRRLLELAAREADIVGLCGLRFRTGAPPPDISGFKAEAVEERLAWLRAAAGDRFEQLELSALVQQVIVTDDRQQAAADYAAGLSSISAEDLLQSPYVLIGTVDELVEQIFEQCARWGITYYIAFEAAIQALAPIVARLV